MFENWPEGELERQHRIIDDFVLIVLSVFAAILIYMAKACIAAHVTLIIN